MYNEQIYVPSLFVDIFTLAQGSDVKKTLQSGISGSLLSLNLPKCLFNFTSVFECRRKYNLAALCFSIKIHTMPWPTGMSLPRLFYPCV